MVTAAQFTALQRAQQTSQSIATPNTDGKTGNMARNLTPAQQRAVAIAQQQILMVRQARQAKNERQQALNRMGANSESDEEDAVLTSRTETSAKSLREVVADSDQISLRRVQGSVLRSLRTKDHKTLREVSEKAGVSLGYLSEVERGQKEASSELLSSITEALGVRLSEMLMMVSERVREVENELARAAA